MEKTYIVLPTGDNPCVYLLDSGSYMETKYGYFKDVGETPYSEIGKWEFSGVYPRKRLYANEFFTTKDGTRYFRLCGKFRKESGLKYAQN